jgi:hypothetical protein
MILVISVAGWSASYDPFLLETQLTLLPKITILDKNVAFNNSKSPIKILIAYELDDEDTASKCSKILLNKFNRNLNGHPIVVTTLPFDKLDSSTSYHLIYALKANVSQLKKVRNAVSSATVTALYDADKLSDAGFLLSIRMERAPIILINAKVLRENKISFPDSLLEIARII